jgi:hypothetical protein
MVFLGEWKPTDFQQQGEPSGRDLFLAIADPECHGLWPAGEDPGEWWVTCFVFRCTVCGALAAKIDYS